MKIPDEPDVPTQINVVPMIDVIFAVLAFLIVSSLFLTRPEGLPVDLPEASTAEPTLENPLVVTIDESGAIALNQSPTSLKTLAAAVEVLAAQKSAEAGRAAPVLLVLNADERVSHGAVIAVMDELRQVEEVQLGIATQQPQPEN
ncbi:MAG: ExbD/TolR family protein [Elainellaceae cyanobacterium]